MKLSRSAWPVAAVALAWTSCSHTVYRLSPEMAGQEMRCEGTVWSVESDGDFLMESHGRMVFVDADEVRHDLEMGDRVTVGGIVDADEGEAPELDATTLTRLGHRVAEPK